MIRSPKPETPEQILRGRIRDTKAQIKQLEQPSTHGWRHEARMRPRWNAKAATLREHLSSLQAELDAINEARKVVN